MHRSSFAYTLSFVFPSVLTHIKTLLLVTVFGTVAIAVNAGEVVIKERGSFGISSHAREMAAEVAKYGIQTPTDVVPDTHLSARPPNKDRAGNVEVNDASLDRFTFSSSLQRVIGRLSESETSIAARGRTIVATYNTSAFPTGSLLVSGFSTSLDNGQTWASGFFPPFQGLLAFTLGDPVIATDRAGQFHFAGMSLAFFSNCGFCLAFGVNTSTDGLHWSNPVAAVVDNNLDKPWLAVGPDPVFFQRDNVYLTYTHFGSDFSRVDFTRSLDGSKTWDAPKTIFAPTADARLTSVIQGTAPYVDPKTGYLYVPFLHFGQSDQDYLRILKSKDGGDTFTMVTFNDPTAPDTHALTITAPGELTDCGADGGNRLTIHAGTATTPQGINRYEQAARLGFQPAFAARGNILYLTWGNSQNDILGDNDGSNVFFMRSDDGGDTWTVRIQVNPDVATDKHHVMPNLALGHAPTDVHVLYWTQHTDETVDTALANSKDGGNTFPANRTIRVSSTNSALSPTNVTLDATHTFNYDFFSKPCYNLGEYLDVESASGNLYLLWADDRNSVTHPVNDLDPLSGQTHSQADVFFRSIHQ
jgi:hypothetical protein